MERLIAFGCSLTYGHGLKDCFETLDKPSEYAWPSIVSKYMNRECVNKSNPGASNKRIWNNIINFNYRENDIVFVLWTYPERTSIIKRNSVVDIGPWMDSVYYNLYDEYDSNLMSKLFINHSNMFLTEKNIKVYNLVAGEGTDDIINLNNKIANNLPVYIYKLKKKYPKALDKNHPGQECHYAFAKEILNCLGIENDIPEQKKIKFLGLL